MVRKKTLKTLVTACSPVPLLLACVFGPSGAANVVRRDQTGGVLALQGDRNEAMAQAQQMMAAHCGANAYAVTTEENVVVGQQTNHQENTNYGNRYGNRYSSGGQSTNANTTTTDVTEYRITYVCGAAAPPAVVAPAPASSGSP